MGLLNDAQLPDPIVLLIGSIVQADLEAVNTLRKYCDEKFIPLYGGALRKKCYLSIHRSHGKPKIQLNGPYKDIWDGCWMLEQTSNYGIKYKWFKWHEKFANDWFHKKYWTTYEIPLELFENIKTYTEQILND